VSLTVPAKHSKSTPNLLNKLNKTISSLGNRKNVASVQAWHHVAMGQGIKILRRSDFFQVMHVAKPPTQQMACLLMMRAGFRSGEVCLARHEDVDINYSDIRKSAIYVFDIKNKKHVPLSMHRDLITTYEQLKNREDYILKRHERYRIYGDKPVTRAGLNEMVKRWAKKAGVRDWNEFNPRTLRSFFAKEWVRQKEVGGKVFRGGSIQSLQAAMRHRHPFTTWIYLQQFMFLEDLHEEMERQYELPQNLDTMEDLEIE